jgi:hypothetical protein
VVSFSWLLSTGFVLASLLMLRGLAIRRYAAVLRLVTGNTGGAKYMPLNCNLKGLNLQAFFQARPQWRTNSVPLFLK